MGFFDELRSQNTVGSGGGSYYGEPGRDRSDPAGMAQSLMPIFDRIRNRDLEDLQAKTRIAGDEAIRQEHFKKLFNPDNMSDGPGGQQNTVMAPTTPNPATQPITPYQNAQLGLDKMKLAQDASTGADRQSLNEQRLKLDTEKNANIYETKQRELSDKAEAAQNKLQLAYDQLMKNQGDSIAHDSFLRAQLEATKAQHELENAQHTAELEDRRRSTTAQITDLQERLKLLQAPTVTTTNVNDAGNERTTTTTKQLPPKAPAPVAGYTWKRNAANNGWTAVEAK